MRVLQPVHKSYEKAGANIVSGSNTLLVEPDFGVMEVNEDEGLPTHHHHQTQ